MSVIDELGLPPLPEPLPRPIIDNHTHLASTHGYSGLPVAEVAAASGQAKNELYEAALAARKEPR